MFREQGIGMSLSGGGYRAMLYHLGTLVRLHELDQLRRLNRISSVSGGSITAGVLALRWSMINSRQDLFDYVVDPIRALADKTIDRSSILRGVILRGSAANYIADQYNRHLFKGATLQDIPASPRFVINATSLETGVLWRFSQPYMRDYKVGSIEKPTLRLADAVAASSAFPPFLSPFRLKVAPAQFTIRETGVPDEFLRDIALTDGGVYDNYGLEPIWDRYTKVLVSDGGGGLSLDASPSSGWGRQAYRVLNVIHQQVHSIRSRQVVQAYRDGETEGAFWSIRTPVRKFPVHMPEAPSDEAGRALAEIPTRLKKMSAALQEQLINFGYIGCDAALRSYFDADLAPPRHLPYPERRFGR